MQTDIVGNRLAGYSAQEKLTQRHFLTPWRIVALVSLLLALAALAIWFASAAAATNQPVTIPSSAFANLVHVNVRPLKHAGPDFLTGRYTGIVTAHRQSSLAAKRLGRVEKIHVDIGDTVAAGDVLAEMDSDELRAQQRMLAANLAAANSSLNELKQGPREQEIEQAKSRVTELEANVKLSAANSARSEELYRRAAISEQESDESKFALQAAQAQLNVSRESLKLMLEGTRYEQIETQRATVGALQADLDRIAVSVAETQILAPYAGQIESRLIDEGTVVMAGDPILKLVETGDLEIRLGLPPEIVRSDLADRIKLVWQDRSYQVRLARVAPMIDQRTRNQEVVLKLAGEDANTILPTGASVQVELAIPVIGDGFWIPTDTLTAASRGLWAVMIAEPNNENVNAENANAEAQTTAIVQLRQVELLRSQGAWSEVRGAVSSDDLLIVEGVHLVTPGQQVTATMD